MSAGPVSSNDQYDPTAIPIRPAATVMVVDDAPGAAAAALRVLMLRRTAGAVFGGDMWVYPGGRVDDEDEAIAAGHVVGLDAAEANRRLGLTRGGLGGLAYWVAALRECFEEAGILLARRAGDGEAIDVSDAATVARLQQRRAALNAGSTTFADIIRDEGVVLDATRIHYIAHWITPLGPPRRFDTRFFLAAAPTGQVAAHDDNEIVHHDWVAPGHAVEAWRADRMAMMSPTARMLMSLAAFDRAADAVAAAAADVEAHQIRVRRIDETYHILLPGDDGWDDGDPDTEFGWVKLRPPTS
jgi:8-oxo-dGTP pyrophosphatase MutT (NUDIX family)